MPHNLTNEKSTLVQVITWCLQRTSHYLSQCWPRSMSPYGITVPQWVNIRVVQENSCFGCYRYLKAISWHPVKQTLYVIRDTFPMMTSSNGNIFRVTGNLCGSPVNYPHKGQWRGALMFSLICVWINGWVNNHKAGDLKCYCAHYGVIVMHI